MRDKAVTVLNNLLDGGEVSHEGQTFLLDANLDLCVKARKYSKPLDALNGENGEDVLIKVSLGNVSLPEFIKWARKLPDDDIAIMGANIALNKIIRGSRKREIAGVE